MTLMDAYVHNEEVEKVILVWCCWWFVFHMMIFELDVASREWRDNKWDSGIKMWLNHSPCSTCPGSVFSIFTTATWLYCRECFRNVSFAEPMFWCNSWIRGTIFIIMAIIQYNQLARPQQMEQVGILNSYQVYFMVCAQFKIIPLFRACLLTWRAVSPCKNFFFECSGRS